MVRLIPLSCKEYGLCKLLAEQMPNEDISILKFSDTLPVVEKDQIGILHIFGGGNDPLLVQDVVDDARKCGYHLIWSPFYANSQYPNMAMNDLFGQDYPLIYSSVRSVFNKILGYCEYITCSSYYEYGSLAATFDLGEQPNVLVLQSLIMPLQFGEKENAVGIVNSWRIEEGNDILFESADLIHFLHSQDVPVKIVNLPPDSTVDESYYGYLRSIIEPTVQRYDNFQLIEANDVMHALEILSRYKIYLDLSYENSNPFIVLSLYSSGSMVVVSPMGNVMPYLRDCDGVAYCFPLRTSDLIGMLEILIQPDVKLYLDKTENLLSLAVKFNEKISPYYTALYRSLEEEICEEAAKNHSQ